MGTLQPQPRCEACGGELAYVEFSIVCRTCPITPAGHIQKFAGAVRRVGGIKGGALQQGDIRCVQCGRKQTIWSIERRKGGLSFVVPAGSQDDQSAIS